MIIYKITNTINNKVYIGQSIKTLKERIADYRKEYLYRKGYERPIIRAMRKYGFEYFKFETLVNDIKSQEEMDELEIQKILEFNSLIDHNGYNLKKGGQGGKHHESTKKKIGEAQKGELNHMYGRIGELNPTSKATVELTTGIIYESACLAAEATGTNISHVCAVCRGERGSTGDFVFRYIENGIPVKPNKTTMIKSKEIRNRILDQYKDLL